MTAIPNNPIINARYQVAGLIFFWIDYFFYGRKTKFLAAMLVVGVLVAPSLQVFRHYDSTTQDFQSNGLFGSTLLAKDYDAFLMSCYTMLTVDAAGVGWGSNLVGAVLFFVPRAMWTNKPEPTAWIVYDIAAHTTDLGTNNLSTPLMAEGYYAFGWAGALLIALCYWWGITKITLVSRRNPDSWAFLFRCVCTGLALIFLRGTLIVGVSALAGTFAAAAIPAFLLRFTGRRHALRSGRGLGARVPTIARNSRHF
jgi:hypothetical protein